jgi:Ca-activated chloride channel homolog
MFRIEYIPAFLLLISIVVAILLFNYVKRRASERIGKINSSSSRALLVDRSGGLNSRQKLFFFGIIAFLQILAIANPQWGRKSTMAKVESADIYLAIDISSSMETRDVSPSRIERAKKLAEEIILSRKGDRIGLILFAGNAYLQMPLTSDIGAALTFVRAVNTNMAGTQGTAISAAINLAVKNLKDRKPTSRALIVLSDGEDHEEDATDAASEAAEMGMHVFTIGIGTVAGGYVPMVENGRDGFKMDEKGDPVLSKVNFGSLDAIAKSGKGNSYRIENTNRINNDLTSQLDAMSKEIHEVKSLSEGNSFYWIFALLALILILTQIYGLKTNFFRQKQS